MLQRPQDDAADRDDRKLETLLEDLYARQLRIHDDPYLGAHSNNRAVIRRHVDSFKAYRGEVRNGRLLDWGCMHGVDSSLVRETFGAAVEPYGCDLQAAPYEVFAAHSGLRFKQLEHPFLLPYQSDSFDTVIGSGVLEHVPCPDASLREIARVLRSEGRLIITFLPNRYSYTELGRTLLRQDHHERRYTPRGITRQLRGNGFEPLRTDYHQVVPTLAGVLDGPVTGLLALRPAVERLYAANRRLERTWPFKLTAANILVVARKA